MSSAGTLPVVDERDVVVGPSTVEGRIDVTIGDAQSRRVLSITPREAALLRSRLSVALYDGSTPDADAEREALIQGRVDAASQWPWKITDGVESEILFEGECGRCENGLPLIRVETRTWDGERSTPVHFHQVEAHHVASASGEAVTGNYDYEDGGILNQVDTELIEQAPADLAWLLGRSNRAREMVTALRARSREGDFPLHLGADLEQIIVETFEVVPRG